MTKRELIIETVSKILEQFAFMFMDFEEDEDELEFISSYMGASITFEGGGHKGVIEVYLPEEATFELAANVLGCDVSEITPVHAVDGLKELINIICGDLSVSLYGNQNIYHLTIPEEIKIDDDCLEELVQKDEALCFMLEDEPAIVVVKISDN